MSSNRTRVAQHAVTALLMLAVVVVWLLLLGAWFRW